jgi:hypothetical protein
MCLRAYGQATVGLCEHKSCQQAKPNVHMNTVLEAKIASMKNKFLHLKKSKEIAT